MSALPDSLQTSGSMQQVAEQQPRRERPIVGHGSNSTYINRGCRCDRCKQAHTEYERGRRERAARRLEPGAALAPRQQDTLMFIEGFVRGAGFPPSLSEICEGLGLNSKSTAKAHLDALTRKGFIEWPFGRNFPRAYRVVRGQS